MNNQEILERYIQLCIKSLNENTRIRPPLRKHGFTESFLFETFRLGYSGGSLIELIQGNGDLNKVCDCGCGSSDSRIPKLTMRRLVCVRI